MTALMTSSGVTLTSPRRIDGAERLGRAVEQAQNAERGNDPCNSNDEAIQRIVTDQRRCDIDEQPGDGQLTADRQKIAAARPGIGEHCLAADQHQQQENDQPDIVADDAHEAAHRPRSAHHHFVEIVIAGHPALEQAPGDNEQTDDPDLNVKPRAERIHAEIEERRYKGFDAALPSFRECVHDSSSKRKLGRSLTKYRARSEQLKPASIGWQPQLCTSSRSRSPAW
jgi:hypothetical protein